MSLKSSNSTEIWDFISQEPVAAKGNTLATENLFKTLSSKSPVYDLPTELLEQIFLSISEPDDWPLIAFTTSSRGRNDQSLCSLPTVLLISTVCHRWRVLALALPLLWSKFHIKLHYSQWKSDDQDSAEPDTVSMDWSLSRLRFFLERSEHHPLTFRFEWYSQTMNQARKSLEVDAFCDIASLLVDNSERWHDACFRIYISGLNGLGDVLAPFERLAGRIQRLKHLEVTSCILFKFIFRPLLGRRDTHVLDSVQLKQSGTVDVLPYMPKAKTLFLEHLHTQADYIVRRQIIDLPSLQEFYVRADGNRALANLLRYCRMPNLEKLNLHAINTRSNWDFLWEMSPVLDLFERSGFGTLRGPGLTHLVLSCIAMSDSQFISILGLNPTLSYLEVQESYPFGPHDDFHDLEVPTRKNFAITNAFAARFTRSSGLNSDFLPRLADLVLTNVAWDGLDQLAFVDALASRKPGSPAITGQRHLRYLRLTLEATTPIDSSVRMKLSEAIFGCGMDGGVSYHVNGEESEEGDRAREKIS